MIGDFELSAINTAKEAPIKQTSRKPYWFKIKKFYILLITDLKMFWMYSYYDNSQSLNSV